VDLLSSQQLGELSREQLETHLREVRARLEKLADEADNLRDDTPFGGLAMSPADVATQQQISSERKQLAEYEGQVAAALAQIPVPTLPGIEDGPNQGPVRPTEQVAGGNDFPLYPDPPKAPAPQTAPDYGGPDDIDAIVAADSAAAARDRLDVDDDESDALPHEPARQPSTGGDAPKPAPHGSTFDSADPNAIKFPARGDEPMQLTTHEDTTYTPSGYAPELTTPDTAEEDGGGGVPWPVIGAAAAAIVVAAGATFAIVHAVTGSSPSHPLAAPTGLAVASPAGAAPASNLQVQGGFDLGSDGTVRIAVVMNQGTHAVTIDFTGPGVPSQETFQVPASPGITPTIGPPPPNWPCTPASFTAQVVAIDGTPLTPTEQSQPTNRWTASEGAAC
jgi:hypothetical protein